MTRRAASDGGLVLTGIDGSNSLAFLAAIGTLRGLTLALPHADVKMGWRQYAGAWRPVVSGDEDMDEEFLLNRLCDHLNAMCDHPALGRWDNLGVRPEEFRTYALDACDRSTMADRIWADYAVGFGCEAVTTRDSKKAVVVEDTAFRTMSGAGHQDFLGFMRRIIASTNRELIRKALFSEWLYDDPVTNSTLRWDPADDVRHALQWRNPSGDPARKTSGTVLGANRLAIEGLPAFPTAPVGSRLETTAFTGTGRRGTFLTWPIWRVEIGLDTCRSLLALDELQGEAWKPARLRARGVVAVYRSQRITEGKYRSFTPARAVMTGEQTRPAGSESHGQDPTLAEIVRRLVDAYQPQRIYLFGSKARGDEGPDSDYDLLVVVPDDASSERRDSRLAYEVLRGTGTAADVLVCTIAYFEARRHLRASLPGTVLREGKQVHAA